MHRAMFMRGWAVLQGPCNSAGCGGQDSQWWEWAGETEAPPCRSQGRKDRALSIERAGEIGDPKQSKARVQSTLHGESRTKGQGTLHGRASDKYNVSWE